MKKYIIAYIVLLFSWECLYAQPLTPQLYFCEKYSDGIEFGVNTTFATGNVVIMLDLRPINKIIGVNKVFIKITKLADKDGFYPDEILIDRIPYEVGPDWDYLYFEESERIKFNEPGVYRVYCLNENGEAISSAFLKVIQQ